MADVTYIPENQGNNNILPWMLAGSGWNNGGIFGGQGLSAFIGGALGALFPNLFGWNNGGFNGLGGNGAGFISNQLNNDSGRELLMNAITSQGEASRTATQSLATMLGQDFDLVNAGIQSVQTILSNIATQQAVSVPQIINAIQSGNASLASQLCQCCCENRLLTTQQGYEAQIRTLEQTNALGSQADRNTRSITDAIAAQSIMINDKFCDLEKRELQGTIARQSETITQLRGQIDNANQTAAITGYINSLVSPIAKDVDDIKCRIPSTVNVPYPNLTAVNTTPYMGMYGYGFNGGSYWG